MTSVRATTPARGRPQASGFSNAEALVACTVMVTVLLALYMIYDTANQNHSRGLARAAVQQDLRPAFERLARELRGAGYTPSKTGCASPPAGGVTALSFSPVSVTFLADVNADLCTDQVTYTFIPPTKNPSTNPCDPSDPATVGIITRSVQTWTGVAWNPAIPTPVTVATCVTDLALTYYGSSGATTTIPANVVRVSASIAGVENSRLTTGQPYTLTTDVRARNL